MTVGRGRPVAIVSTSPLVAACWCDAVAQSTVFGGHVDPDELAKFPLIVLDVPTIGQLRQLLRGASTDPGAQRRLWIHADIEPDDIRNARQLGVTQTIHRAGGLAPVLAAIGEEDAGPRVSMIGRIRDPAALDRLSEDELLLLRRLGAGATVTQLRASTGWSKHTVERLRVSALSKLGVQTTGEALAITHAADAGTDRAQG
ncbi:MAG: hypothetical protein JWM12_977 [Ilumatobacteraceae bacterium]|nr:hypothetical protein [Ilumatobacteraceae bacterium]